MQLSCFSYYALRVLMYVAQNDGKHTTIAEIARNTAWYIHRFGLFSPIRPPLIFGTKSVAVGVASYSIGLASTERRSSGAYPSNFPIFSEAIGIS